MTVHLNDSKDVALSWFVQAYYKPYAATAVLTESMIEPIQDSMSSCQVRLFGLKPCDINFRSNSPLAEGPFDEHGSRQQPSSSSSSSAQSTPSPDTSYLHLHIKPLAVNTPPSRSSMHNDTSHEASPIRVMMTETSRGRHRICISQTLLRSHNSHV